MKMKNILRLPEKNFLTSGKFLSNRLCETDKISINSNISLYLASSNDTFLSQQLFDNGFQFFYSFFKLRQFAGHCLAS